MVEYTIDDYGLDQIVPTLPFGLATATTRHQYHVFGLRTEGRPHVSIVGGLRGPMEDIARLLQRSSLVCHIDGRPDISVNIGLRRDLRERPEYATKLLATIIQMLEGKMEPLAISSRLPVMPTTVAITIAPAGPAAVVDAQDIYVLAKLDSNGEALYADAAGGQSETPHYFVGRIPPPNAMPHYHWIKIDPGPGAQQNECRWLVSFEMHGGASVRRYRTAGHADDAQTIEDAFDLDSAVLQVLMRYRDGPMTSIGVITWMEE